jgi:ferredoxin
MYPKIEIDHAKCTIPFDCKKCLQKCPQAVFDVRPMKMTRLVETNKKEPGAYKVFALFRDKCTACNECVEICPVDALKVTC